MSSLPPRLLAIDLGTTRLKVAAFAPSGELLQQLAVRHKDGDGGMDANRWWQDAARLLRKLAGPDVSGISLCGRGGAAIFLDDNGDVLAQPWADGRHRDELARLYAWRRDDGRHLSNYGAALVAKYLWLRRHRPSIAKRCRFALYAKDFLLHRLTGCHATDWSSGPDAPNWDERLFDDFDVPRTLLPTPKLPWEIVGKLTDAAAGQTGLPPGLPVALGAHDGICANVGAGAVGRRQYAITLGTHAVVRTATATVPSGAYRFYALPPDRHVIGGNAVLGGRAVDWLLDMTHGGDRDDAYREAERCAAGVAIGAEGLSFLPFLAGQVAPEHRPGASGAFVGLGLRHGSPSLYRAVLEGAAFAIADIVDQVAAWCGPPARVRLTGGGAASRLWASILADVLATPVEASDAAVEGRGAAIFLATALGLYPDHHAAAAAMVPPPRRIEPDAARVARYRTVRERWNGVRDTLRALDEVAEGEHG